MSYTINEQLSDTEWTAAINTLATFGTPRRIESITIHHWGSFGQTHYGVVDFFVNRNANTSAHFVASDNLIHCLVSPENTAWAAGNAYGNATSIHIEARPEATDGDYRTVSWLVAWIRSVYGPGLPLRAHSSWSATACPGKWDLARVDREARAWTAKEFTKSGTIETQSVTPKEDTLSAKEVQEIKNHINAVLLGGYSWAGKKHPGIVDEIRNVPVKTWATPIVRTGGKVSALQELADVKTKVLGIEPAIARIDANTDPAALADLIPDALAQQVIDKLAERLGK